MANYTISKAEEKKRFQGSKGGEFIVWKVELYDGEGYTPAEWVKKAESKAPVEKEQVEGTVEATDYGMKFKPAQNGSFGGGGGKSPEQQKSIVRQHSQEMAIRWATVLQQSGQWPTEATSAERKRTLVSLIDFFQADAEPKAP